MKLLSGYLRVVSVLFLALCFLAGFSNHSFVAQTVYVIIVVYLLFVLFRTVFFFFGSFKEKAADLRFDSEDQGHFSQPLISIIVPAYNESKTLKVALQSLAELDYPSYEIVVIDDGSRDDTTKIAQQFAKETKHIEIKVISQPNQGKAAALNHGILQASGDLFVCVDADSKLTKESLKMASRHFENPKVGAVAGFVEIANQTNLLLKLQQLEYLVGLNFTRRALSFLGVVPIVPGPAGMFRRQALFQAGGFKTDQKVFAEDAELSLRILNMGWEIRSEEDMVAVTEAPESVKALLRQRYRWNRGTYQALMQNLKLMIEYGGIRGLWLGIYLFTETAITPFLNMGLIFYFFSHYIHTGNLEIFTSWYLYLLALDLMTVTLVTYKHGQLWRWLSLTFVNKFYYYYMLLTWRLVSLHEEWADQEMTWDKLERKGKLQLGEVK